MLFRDSMNMLEKRGHKTLAFNAVAKGATIDEKYYSIMDDKVIHEECFYTFDRYNYFYKQKKIYRRFIDKVDVDEYDIIHSHTMFNGGWVANKLKRKKNIPYVVTVRNTDLNDFLKFPFFVPIAKRIAKESNAIMFLSESYKKQFLQKVYGKASEEIRNTIKQKCYVIPNGLEDYWLENVSKEKEVCNDVVKLICVGKIDFNKNMKSIVEAMNILEKRGVNSHLTVIGQVVDNNVLVELQKSSKVEIVPYQKKEELINYYRSSDIFVMPSFTESFGRVYAEAMTQGLPVIYTKKQGFDGFFKEGEVGYSVDAHNPETIADAIDNIIHNYNMISYNCIKNCIIFNWNDIAKKLEYMYMKAIK